MAFIKKYVFLFLLVQFNAKGQQIERKDFTQLTAFQTSKDVEEGIVYFSFDNGDTWKNASAGIPQNVRIGLGGLTATAQMLGIATKDNGVFRYDRHDSLWVKVPTNQRIIDGNIGAIIYYNNAFWIGTQSKGVFNSNDMGKNWNTQNIGLANLTIRRFLSLDNKLYVCTNEGFYIFDEKNKSWKIEYSENALQVNGATVFRNEIYIATNKGIYRKSTDQSWKNVLPNHSVHNISADDEQLYGMTYTSLLMSSKDGVYWQSLQNGLPKDLYTFNVLTQNKMVFAGQWDGVYRKNSSSTQWKLSSNGLPPNFAVTNLKRFHSILVISTSERKLKKGVSIDK